MELKSNYVGEDVVFSVDRSGENNVLVYEDRNQVIHEAFLISLIDCDFIDRPVEIQTCRMTMKKADYFLSPSKSPFSAEETIQKIVSIISDVHRSSIVHGSLQLQSFAVRGEEIFLTGFSTSLFEGGKPWLDLNLPYISPEAWEEKNLTCKADVFNLGLIMYEILSETSLEISTSDLCENLTELTEKTSFRQLGKKSCSRLGLLNGEILLPGWENVPSTYQDLISSCILPNPDDRPSIFQIAERLGLSLRSTIEVETENPLSDVVRSLTYPSLYFSLHEESRCHIVAILQVSQRRIHQKYVLPEDNNLIDFLFAVVEADDRIEDFCQEIDRECDEVENEIFDLLNGGFLRGVTTIVDYRCQIEFLLMAIVRANFPKVNSNLSKRELKKLRNMPMIGELETLMTEWNHLSKS
nr:serine/threonine protein kinase [Pithovirus mammoth]